VEIDGLDASSVTIQALHGPIDSEGEFIGTPLIVTLALTGAGLWEADYSVGEAGPYGLTVRALPSHPNLISPVEMGTIAWAV
jgi:starch phosphorylase